MVEDTERNAAVKRVKDKRDLRTHVFVYLVVNAMLVVIWAVSGAGYFWPIWSIGGWGLGLIFNWWSAYHENRPITEADIEREMGKRQ